MNRDAVCRLAAMTIATATAACTSKGGPSSGSPGGDDGGAQTVGGGGRAVKVMIVNMVFLEAQPFVSGLALTQDVVVPGLSSGSPKVHCNADDVCEITTGMGYANVASSMSALLYRGGFDLTHTYFVIAGLAGVDPAQGTLGSAAWARYVVDFGLANEIDAREMPAGWPYGYFGLGTKTPADTPVPTAGTEAYTLDEALLQRAFALSKDVVLDDEPGAMAFRAHFTTAPANQPPHVIQCDSASSDTWFAGKALTTRVRDWTKLVTGGKGVYCMSEQEDNATLEVLTRGAAAGIVDAKRVAALRSGSDFSEPYDGQTDSDSLVNYIGQGGLGPAMTNLFKAAQPLIAAIVSGWSEWQAGVPPG
jgi:purine nucleoside permease